MLAAGIALGALIGPGPATSLANGTRTAAIARALALLALDDGSTGAGGLLGAAQAPSASAHTPGDATRGATHALANPEAATKTPSAQPAARTGSTTPSNASSPSSANSSPTPKTTAPGASSETQAKGKPLPAIAQVWLIVLPYGQGFANAQAQPTAAPYLDGQLIAAGTLLSNYSALDGSQLAGSAALLSGQVAAGVNVLSPPACVAAATAGTTGPQSSGGAAEQPCPGSEPAGLQAADTYVREVVSKLLASAEYREHGLIAITFAASSSTGAGTTGSPAGAAGTSTNGETAYPAGTQATTLTNASAPPGVLLLSPFLRAAGKHLSSAFDVAAPHKSLEEILTQPKAP